MRIRTTANLKCPACGFVQKVEMPLNACQHFYLCVNCKTKLKPRRDGRGDCCVFCSHADVKCPPKQRDANEKRSSRKAAKPAKEESSADYAPTLGGHGVRRTLRP